MSRNRYDNAFLEEAHKRSIFHEKELKESKKCGCFHCQNIFEVNKIIDWVDEEDSRGKTALCPFCTIDSVLSDNLPIDDTEFLKAMNNRYCT